MILAHAMDALIYEIATAFNGGSLRVTDAPDYSPMFFAPGFDANPLVPTSNPRDIAEGINRQELAYERRTIVGRNRFLADLELAGRATVAELQDWYLRAPSGRVVVITCEPGQLSTDYRQGPGLGQLVAHEFLSAAGSAIAPGSYALLSSECHIMNDGMYTHEMDRGSP